MVVCACVVVFCVCVSRLIYISRAYTIKCECGSFSTVYSPIHSKFLTTTFSIKKNAFFGGELFTVSCAKISLISRLRFPNSGMLFIKMLKVMLASFRSFRKDLSEKEGRTVSSIQLLFSRDWVKKKILFSVL